MEIGMVPMLIDDEFEEELSPDPCLGKVCDV